MPSIWHLWGSPLHSGARSARCGDDVRLVFPDDHIGSYYYEWRVRLSHYYMLDISHKRIPLLRIQHWHRAGTESPFILHLPHPHSLPRHVLPSSRQLSHRRHLRAPCSRNGTRMVPLRHANRPSIRPIHRRMSLAPFPPNQTDKKPRASSSRFAPGE